MPRLGDTILVLDDEPFFLQWFFDFLETQGYHAKSVTTIEQALSELAAHQFRAVVADLNVPASDSIATTLVARGDIYRSYPGLFVADYARNHHHTGRQVIVYSVHDSADVRKETQRLQCTYLLKGRPRSFKNEVKDVLSFDPLQHL